MARPKTQSPTVGFRLSLAAYDELATRSARAGLTPSEYLKNQVERSLTGPTRLEPARPAAKPVVKAVAKHPGWRISSGGLEVCTACAGVRARVSALPCPG